MSVAQTASAFQSRRRRPRPPSRADEARWRGRTHRRASRRSSLQASERRAGRWSRSTPAGSAEMPITLESSEVVESIRTAKSSNSPRSCTADRRVAAVATRRGDGAREDEPLAGSEMSVRPGAVRVPPVASVARPVVTGPQVRGRSSARAAKGPCSMQTRLLLVAASVLAALTLVRFRGADQPAERRAPGRAARVGRLLRARGRDRRTA